jgi:alkanesulfonate monooxygenase SsuD/methylene tetrahydromethanopterin reductase-like flavin-dependent oxidoreductase (luciferase family)
MLGVGGATGVSDVRDRARAAEESGLDSVFVGDHLVSDRPTLDSVVALAAVAAVTQRVRVGFAVLVLPLRHVAWVAKQVATLQVLSGDRVILGVGTGGGALARASAEAAGVPWAERGRRTDAALAVLPRLVAGEPTSLDGGPAFSLAPSAQVPPIWVGGGSPAALRRTVAHGTAWFPSMVPAEFVAQGAARLRQFAADAGRPAPAAAVGGAAVLGPDASPALLAAYAEEVARRYGVPPGVAARVPITGSAAEAAERFAAYARAGAEHLVLSPIGGDWRRQCELIAEARALLA